MVCVRCGRRSYGRLYSVVDPDPDADVDVGEDVDDVGDDVTVGVPGAYGPA